MVAPEATLPVFRTLATNSETAPGITSAGPTISNSSDGVAGRTVEAGRLLAAGSVGGGAPSGWGTGNGGGDMGAAAKGAAAKGAAAKGAAIASGGVVVGGGATGIVGAVG